MPNRRKPPGEKWKRRRTSKSRRAQPKDSGRAIFKVKLPRSLEPDFPVEKYPALAPLVEEWAPRVLRSVGKEARSMMMAVYRAAVESLPERPTELHYLAYFTGLYAEKGYAGQTVHRYKAHLNTLYELARLKGGLWLNPLARMRLPGIPQETVSVLPLTHQTVMADFRRTLAVLDDPRDRLYLGFLRYLGIRESEALGFIVSDWNIKKGTILLARQRSEDGFAVGKLKGGDKHIRELDVPPGLAKLLAEVVRLGPALARLKFKHGPVVEVPFLCPQRKTQLDALHRKICAVIVGLDESGYRWHAWRHAWALEMDQIARLPLEDISKQLGHVNRFTTQRYLERLRGYPAGSSAKERAFAAQEGLLPEDTREGAQGHLRQVNALGGPASISSVDSKPPVERSTTSRGRPLLRVVKGRILE